MTPDYEKAATKAAEILIQHGIKSAPIDPVPILKNTPGVLLLSFQEMSDRINVTRREILCRVGRENQDAVTTAFVDGEHIRYIVAYNQQLPFHLTQRALARELGHIVLGHDGTGPEDVRNSEAIAFANYLLTNRALINLVQATGIRITREVLGNITGCNDHCLRCLRHLPAVRIDPALNRKLKEQFMPYVINFFEYQRYATLSDGSELVDFGTYMEGYAES